MNWIRVDTGIHDDPRIWRIAAVCNVRVAEIVGCVVGVLAKLPQHARDGAVSELPDGVLETWANWKGRRGRFDAAFRTEMVEDGIVRSWEKYNGAALREAQRQREKSLSYRAKQKAGPLRDGKPGETLSTTIVPGTLPGSVPSHEPGTNPGTNQVASPANGTRRNETVQQHSSLGRLERPRPAEPSRGVAPTGMEIQEAELRAAGLPHEVAALEFLANGGFRPAIIGELHAIASGMHVVRGEHPPYRVAEISDVMRATSEFASKGRQWDVSYFRGCVRRILDRPPEPPDAEARAQAQLARQIAKFEPSAAVAVQQHADLSAEERAAADQRRADAMAHFRAEFRRNNPLAQ